MTRQTVTKRAALRVQRVDLVSVRSATTLVLQAATARTGIVAPYVSHILQSFRVPLVRSAKPSEPVVNRLSAFAQAMAAVPRRKVICDSPQPEDEQDQTGCHGNNEPHGIFSVALSGQQSNASSLPAL